MMTQKLIIMTGPSELPHFAAYAHRVANGQANLHLATSQAALDAAIGSPSDADLAGVRLIACCSSVIVPTRILDRLTLTPYNIHPGSPAYPGVFPEYWAAADDAPMFGATLHAMTQDVDAGPIVEARLVPNIASADAESLGRLAHAQAVALFRDTLPRLVQSRDDLPVKPGLQWTGPYRSRRDFAARFGDVPDPATAHRLAG